MKALIIIHNKFKQRLLYIIRRILLVGIKYNWNKLWIRKDEFHKSLDNDCEIMMHMTNNEREKQMENLSRRRYEIHKSK